VSSNYRLTRCQHCDGEGFVRVGNREDYKNTEKMSQTELAVIVREAVRSPVPPAPTSSPGSRSFPPEPPTLPDEGWTFRHLMQARVKYWRTAQLVLSLLLVVLAYFVGRLR
jgi:hypothetical protein